MVVYDSIMDAHFRVLFRDLWEDKPFVFNKARSPPKDIERRKVTLTPLLTHTYLSRMVPLVQIQPPQHAQPWTQGYPEDREAVSYMKIFAFLLILCTLGLSLLNPWIALYALLGLLVGYLIEEIWSRTHEHFLPKTFGSLKIRWAALPQVLVVVLASALVIIPITEYMHTLPVHIPHSVNLEHNLSPKPILSRSHGIELEYLEHGSLWRLKEVLLFRGFSLNNDAWLNKISKPLQSCSWEIEELTTGIKFSKKHTLSAENPFFRSVRQTIPLTSSLGKCVNLDIAISANDSDLVEVEIQAPRYLVADSSPPTKNRYNLLDEDDNERIEIVPVDLKPPKHSENVSLTVEIRGRLLRSEYGVQFNILIFSGIFSAIWGLLGALLGSGIKKIWRSGRIFCL